jgi:predicted phosphodiesterase
MKIGVIGDIHEDIVALKAALSLLEKAGCTEIVCLGDIVGFKVNTYHYLDTRNGHECIALVRTNCSAVVIGNNDLFQVRRLPRYQGGFEFPENWYDLDFHQRKSLAGNQVFLYEELQLDALLSKADKSWLESLPDIHTANHDGLRVLYSHFAYPDLLGVRAYFPKLAGEFRPHLAFIDEHGCSLGISGHMHFEGLSHVVEPGSQVIDGGIRRQGFGSASLSSGLQYWYGPCIARCQFANGFLVLDTTRNSLEAVPLAAE